MDSSFLDGTGSPGSDDFHEYRRLILSELKRLGRDQEVFAAKTQERIETLQDTFSTKLDSLQHQISDLRAEVKAGERERKALSTVWGLLGGAIPVLLWMALQFFGQ